jgi:DNA-binding GntR family transcriptional regulator
VSNQPVLKSQAVYDGIRAGILSGRYPAGYRLVFDALSDEYGISTVPVREAARRLEAEGLVEFIPNRGAQIASINTRDYLESMQSLAFLEGAAIALGAVKMDAAALAEAKALNDQMAEVAEADAFYGQAFASLNQQFHRLLSAKSGNSHLIDLVTREQERMALIRRGGYSVDSTRARQSVAEHRELLRLIRSGANFNEIELFARTHKLNTLRYYIEHQT